MKQLVSREKWLPLEKTFVSVKGDGIKSKIPAASRAAEEPGGYLFCCLYLFSLFSLTKMHFFLSINPKSGQFSFRLQVASASFLQARTMQ